MCQVAGWNCANIRVSLWCNGSLPSSRGVPGLDFFDVFLKGAATNIAGKDQAFSLFLDFVFAFTKLT